MTEHLDSISSFLAMEVLARAQQLEAEGRDIIHLEVGEPDFQAPPEALTTVIESLSKKPARYTTPKESFHYGRRLLKNIWTIMESK